MSCCPEAAPSSWGKSDATGGKNHLEQYDDVLMAIFPQRRLSHAKVAAYQAGIAHTHTRVNVML